MAEPRPLAVPEPVPPGSLTRDSGFQQSPGFQPPPAVAVTPPASAIVARPAPRPADAGRPTPVPAARATTEAQARAAGRGRGRALESSARARFMRLTGYPTGRPGYVVDHIIPLACGGPDTPDNMQWQTIEEGRRKTKWNGKRVRQSGPPGLRSARIRQPHT